MIARTWRGIVRRADAAEYVRYVADTGLRAFRELPGHRGAYVLRRDDGERSEILVLSLWDSIDAVRAFAGTDVTRAVFYPEDDRFLIDRETRATHFEVAASA